MLLVSLPRNSRSLVSTSGINSLSPPVSMKHFIFYPLQRIIFMLITSGFLIQIQSGQWIRIRIGNPDPDPEGRKNGPQK